MWKKDEFQKLVPHPVQCRIPMLQAHEGDDGKYKAFYEKHKACLYDQVCLLNNMTEHDHPYWGIDRRLHPNIEKSDTNVQQKLDEPKVAQKPNFDSSYPSGLTVKLKNKQTLKLATVIWTNEEGC
eukprot:1754905-Ditylum_brightwellii.AAC.1